MAPSLAQDAAMGNDGGMHIFASLSLLLFLG
jgi:hypothetical protein